MRSTGHGDLFLHNLSDYFSMTKPAIASLNVFVGLATMLLAVGLHVVTANSLLLLGVAGFLAAAGAGALNCFIERRIDSQMNRTRHRPLPSGRVSANAAFSFGLVLSVSGVALAALFLNALTASFIALGIIWYVLVYTLWLKRRTKWNIVIGGAAGSFSALAGWAAVTGSISLVAFLVAFLIFLWTPGHFWGLAIAKAKEYAKVQVPMLPVVDGAQKSAIYAAVSNIALFPFTVGLFALTAYQGNIWAFILLGGILIAYNARFLVANFRMMRHPLPVSAWRVFKMSIVYLFVVLFLVVAAHLV
jgi:protoheme IX farnesyltransferase